MTIYFYWLFLLHFSSCYYKIITQSVIISRNVFKLLYRFQLGTESKILPKWSRKIRLKPMVEKNLIVKYFGNVIKFIFRHSNERNIIKWKILNYFKNSLYTILTVSTVTIMYTTLTNDSMYFINFYEIITLPIFWFSRHFFCIKFL